MAHASEQTPSHGHTHDYPAMTAGQRAEAITAARDLAANRGLSFTKQRQAVFELLLDAGRPVGAYALLDEMAKKEGRGIAPPTVYRALDFLLELGVVSRLESSNEFVRCSHPKEPHDCIFLICTCCRKAVESHDDAIHSALNTLAASSGFKPGRQVIELQGLCEACQ